MNWLQFRSLAILALIQVGLIGAGSRGPSPLYGMPVRFRD